MFPGPGGNRGRFIAWDPTVGKVKFDLKENLAAYGGVLTTAGGVVFYGTMEGWLKAVDARTGTELWRFTWPPGEIRNKPPPVPAAASFNPPFILPLRKRAPTHVLPCPPHSL